MRGAPQIVPMTPVVKRLIIINVVVWLVLILIVGNFTNLEAIYEYLAFVPNRFLQEFWAWQPFTYMFLHAKNVTHLLFNMLLLWWVGAELEVRWGRRYFLFYYFTCGIGAALIYLAGTLVYYAFTGNMMPLNGQVAGSSGAIFGLMYAYAHIFGDRVMYFMLIFPMKARYFILIIGAVELVSLLSQGFASPVAHLAHLGGVIVGFLLLRAGPRVREFFLRRQTRAHGRKLKLVVDNENSGPGKGPRYWN